MENGKWRMGAVNHSVPSNDTGIAKSGDVKAPYKSSSDKRKQLCVILCPDILFPEFLIAPSGLLYVIEPLSYQFIGA